MTKKYTVLFFSQIFFALAAASSVFSQVNNPSSAERFAKPSGDLVAREEKYWARTPLPVPDDIVLEASGIVALPNKQLLVTTRRGEIRGAARGEA